MPLRIRIILTLPPLMRVRFSARPSDLPGARRTTAPRRPQIRYLQRWNGAGSHLSIPSDLPDVPASNHIARRGETTAATIGSAAFLPRSAYGTRLRSVTLLHLHC